MLSENQKSVAFQQFIEAKKSGSLRKTSILEKIKNIKSFSDLKEKINRKIIKDTSFVINNKIASLIYRKKIMKYYCFQIGTSEVQTLIDLLNSSKKLKLSNIQAKGKRGNEQNQEINDKMNINQTWFEIKKNIIFDKLIKKIEPNIREYMKSPFGVVNLNAWKTKANMSVAYDEDGKPRGPNRMHQDGYPSGHYKCLIYLKPLNQEFGRLQIEDKVFESEQPGYSVIFDNSLYHQSIPGASGDKYVLELALMRTIVKVDILKNYPGTPDCIHLQQAYQAYI